MNWFLFAEALTDPSFRGQILVCTYPMIGNYGVPDRKVGTHGEQSAGNTWLLLNQEPPAVLTCVWCPHPYEYHVALSTYVSKPPYAAVTSALRDSSVLSCMPSMQAVDKYGLPKYFESDRIHVDGVIVQDYSHSYRCAEPTQTINIC